MRWRARRGGTGRRSRGRRGWRGRRRRCSSSRRSRRCRACLARAGGVGGRQRRGAHVAVPHQHGGRASAVARRGAVVVGAGLAGHGARGAVVRRRARAGGAAAAGAGGGGAAGAGGGRGVARARARAHRAALPPLPVVVVAAIVPVPALLTAEVPVEATPAPAPPGFWLTEPPQASMMTRDAIPREAMAAVLFMSLSKLGAVGGCAGSARRLSCFWKQATSGKREATPRPMISALRRPSGRSSDQRDALRDEHHNGQGARLPSVRSERQLERALPQNSLFRSRSRSRSRSGSRATGTGTGTGGGRNGF